MGQHYNCEPTVGENTLQYTVQTVDLFIFLLFLIFIWLCIVFEADFHTDPKTFFCLIQRFPRYAMVSDAAFGKK